MKAPKHLSTESKRFWARIVSEYDITPDAAVLCAEPSSPAEGGGQKFGAFAVETYWPAHAYFGSFHNRPKE